MRHTNTAVLFCFGLCFGLNAGAANHTAPHSGRLYAKDFGARCDGASDDTASLASAIRAANASARSLYLPPGICLLRAAPSGDLLKLTGPHMWLLGESRGSTTLRLTGAAALTGELAAVVLAGESEGVEGINFDYAADLNGAFPLVWVAISQGGFDSTVRDCEFRGGYGGNTAGGAAITSYTPLAGVPQIQTALGSPVHPGENLVTPSGGTGMAGIYIGKRLAVGDPDEDVVVSSRTASNFTAVFAHAHASGARVIDRNQNTQRILIENNYIHDCFACSGMTLNSGGSVVRGNWIVNVGLNNFQHGIYVQSGNNRVLDNWIEGVSGYGIHGHKAVPQEDSSGDLYQGNTIFNYARQCIVVDSIASDGANPEVGSGESLDRYVTIADNTCRIGKGAGVSNVLMGIGVQVGAKDSPGSGGVLIVNNTLEDACGTSPACVWISTGVFHNAAVSGNHLRVLNDGGSRQLGISGNGGSGVSIAGNIVENWSMQGPALYLASNTSATGNVIEGAAPATLLVAFSGGNIVFCQNTVIQTGAPGLAALTPSNGVQICENNLTAPAGQPILDLAQIESGSIHDNTLSGGILTALPADAGSRIEIYNNRGGAER